MKQSLQTPPKLTLSPSERHYGVIVTCGHVDGPPWWTFHVPGGAVAALKEACRRIDEAGEGWRIMSISVPSSIFRDLHGTRQDHSERPLGVGTVVSLRSGRDEDPRSYEYTALGRIGRLDLLAPVGWKP